MSLFQIKVTVLGPATTRETNYGPREERDTLATLDIPVTGKTAFRIFGEAYAAATTGTLALVDRAQPAEEQV